MSVRPRLLWKLLPFHLGLSLLTTLGVLFFALRVYPPGETATWPSMRLLVVSFIVAIAGAAAGFAVIWRISRSLEKTRAGAKRFAEGDLDFRLDVPASEELGGLAETLNQMAAQLDDRISTITRQRQEQAAMLGSMIEGVIAVDKTSIILQINQAAATLIGAQPNLLLGRSLAEIVRSHDLLSMLNQAVKENKPVEGEIVMHGTAERSLQVHCTALHDAGGHGIGALIVMNDITRLRRLERVRRDFVANVSHELKTPLTSIKGFVETLLEGALSEPEEARRFCSIIAKQVDRLQAIIEDLLSLSRIEQEVDREQIALKESNLHDLLSSAAQCVALQAAENNITVNIECDPNLQVWINAPLLEQVAVNLIDNAIKYSDPGKTVTVRVRATEQWWEIDFIDQGYGIEAHHQSRIFERFYRVDKARSRKAGGTGLGLAIVKHIVTSHGGRIRVESQLRVGSTLTVCLPRRPESLRATNGNH